METIADAPWIVDVCRDGMPDVIAPTCPVCHAECERVFFRKNDRSDVFGCEKCVDWDPSECWEE